MISAKNINHIFKSVISTDEMISENKKEIFSVIFENDPDESYIEGEVTLTADLFKELVDIAQNADASFEPIYEVGDEIYMEIYLKKYTIEFGLPCEKEPYTDNPNADCFGSFEVDFRNGKILDFDVGCDT